MRSDVRASRREEDRGDRDASKIVALALSAAVVSVVAILGWDSKEIVCQAAFGPLFGYWSFTTGGAGPVHAMVGGLARLVIALGSVEILPVRFSPLRLVAYVRETFTGKAPSLLYRCRPPRKRIALDPLLEITGGERSELLILDTDHSARCFQRRGR